MAGASITSIGRAKSKGFEYNSGVANANIFDVKFYFQTLSIWYYYVHTLEH